MVVELIAKDKNEKLQFQGRCKLIIDSLSKLLLVEPFDEEYKLISAMFKWEFVAQKNIIFVFAEYDFQNFALIFDNRKKCHKVYDILVKKGAVCGSKKLIHDRFFSSQFTEIAANNESNSKMKELLFKWIEKHNGKEKEEYIQILKDNNVFDLIYQNATEKSRKRKFSKRNTQKWYTPKFLERNGNKIVEKSNFEIISFERRKNVCKRLIIFLDSSRDKCYEYTWTNHSKLYKCCGCRMMKHFAGAHICQKEDGTEFVLLKSNEHVCEPRKFCPEKYAERQIVEAGDFQIFKDEKDKSKLVIFASSDKSICYVFFWVKLEKKFSCLGCISKKKSLFAEVYSKQDGSNYLKLSREKHFCKPRAYDPEQFEVSNKEIIESSNFRIFKYKNNGKIITRLVVFYSGNKNLCYEYYWAKYLQIFRCCYCPMTCSVTATVLSKEDSKPYIILSKNQHVCNLREFDPENYKDEIVIEKSMYEITPSVIMKNVKNNILIIFESPEKKCYYKFLYHSQRKCYYCSKCNSLKQFITAYIENEGKENECVYMSNQKHICEPFEYSTITNGNIVMAPNFQLIKRKVFNKIIQRIAVFTNEEKTECFEYTWRENNKVFECFACQRRHKIHVFAKLFKNDTNEECAELSAMQHKCNPIKFIPENIYSKIVKAPDFKLYETNLGKKSVKKLAIFDIKNRNMGYIFNYEHHAKAFVCYYCKKSRNHVTAKILQNENGQNYVELNKREHVCDLQKL